MRILVDMDGVIADWGKQWDAELDFWGEEAARLPRHAEQTTFDLTAGRSKREKEIVAEIFNDECFYESLEPIDGALVALRALEGMGHEVFIVTSPWIYNPTCASQKIAWVREHLGDDWAKRTVITGDKTLVSGDILIDDKPTVTGVAAPDWEHIIFEQPYNLNVARKRRIKSWLDWKTIMEVTA